MGETDVVLRIDAVSEYWERTWFIGWAWDVDAVAFKVEIEGVTEVSRRRSGLVSELLMSNPNAAGAGGCSPTASIPHMSSNQRLQQQQGRIEFLLDVLVLGFDELLLLEDGLQLLMGLLIGQVPDAFLQGLNLGLGPLADGSLCFPIICPFLSQLVGGEVGDAA